jgi:hypothetical protein
MSLDLISMGLMGLGTVMDAYGQKQGAEAAEGAINAERERQSMFDAQVAARLRELLAQSGVEPLTLTPQTGQAVARSGRRAKNLGLSTSARAKVRHTVEPRLTLLERARGMNDQQLGIAGMNSDIATIRMLAGLSQGPLEEEVRAASFAGQPLRFAGQLGLGLGGFGVSDAAHGLPSGGDQRPVATEADFRRQRQRERDAIIAAGAMPTGVQSMTPSGRF